MDQAKKYLKFILGVPLSLASFYFLFKFAIDGWSQVSTQILNPNPLALGSGIFCFFLFFLIRSFAWHKMLETEGFKPDFTKSAYLLSLSEIKRYIPGSVLGFIARINSFNSVKVPAKTTVKLIFYESLIFVLASAALSIPYLVTLPGVKSGFYLYLVLAFFAVPPLGYFAITSKRVKAVLHDLYKYKDPFLIICAAWIFFGLGSYLMGASIHYLNPSKITPIVSSFILSWLVGYLVLIAPLGLGVREAAAAFFLSNVVPLPVAASISVATRIASVFGELLFLLAIFIVDKFRLLPKKINSITVALWSAITAYTAYFTFHSFEKYNNFFTGRFDLGNMDQTVWNTLHGRIFEFTNPDSTESISRLAFHADFILILLAPLYLIWEDARMLLLVQTVVIASGAWFVFKISETLTRNRLLSLFFSISYLLNPFVQKQNLYDFHAVTLATTFLLASFYFLIVKRYNLLFVFLILSAICKEQIWFVAGLISGYVFLKTKNVLWLTFAIFSVGTFYLMLSKIIPSFRGDHHFATEYFTDLGSSVPEIIKNTVLNPLRTFSLLLTESNFEYIHKLFLPVGFLSFAAPLFLIFAGPDFAINLLSKNENFRSLTFHYAAVIIPFIYISAIYSVLLIQKHVKKLAPFLPYYILVFSLISVYQYGTLPGGRRPSLEIFTKPVENRQEIKDFLSRIPENLSVTASNNLGSHLSHRVNLYTLPSGVNEGDVIVILLNDSYAKPSLDEQGLLVEELKNNPDYIQVFESELFAGFAKRDSAKYIRGK